MDIIKLDELAEQAGLGYRRPDGRYWIDAGFIDVHLERFAELVAAEERKGCADHYLQIMRDAVDKAILREREACARLCEDLFLSDGEWCAKSIRARNVSTKSQNVDTSAERVHEIDKSIHEPWDTSDMAHRPNGLTIDDDDIQEYKKPWVGLSDGEAAIYGNSFSGTCLVREIEGLLRERNT